jgi:periplasmic protein CpxP/Spy
MTRRTSVLSLVVASLITVAATALVLDGTASSASGGPRQGFHGHGGGLGLFLHQLNLTDAQRTEIKTIFSQAHQSGKALHKQLWTDKAALRAKFLAPGVLQSSDLAPQVASIAGDEQKILEQRIQTSVAIRNVLTPEQLAQAAQLSSQLEALHQQMHNLLAPPQ